MPHDIPPPTKGNTILTTKQKSTHHPIHNKWLDLFDETFPYPQDFFDIRQEISPVGPWPLIRVLSVVLYGGLMGFGIWFLYYSYTDTTAVTTVSTTFLTPDDSPAYYCTMLNRYTGQYVPLSDDSTQHITYVKTLDTYESCLERLKEAQPCKNSMAVQSQHISQGDPYPLNGNAGGAVLDNEGNLYFGSTGNGPYYSNFNSGGVGPDPNAATVKSIGYGIGTTVMTRNGSDFYYVDITGKIVYRGGFGYTYANAIYTSTSVIRDLAVDSFGHLLILDEDSVRLALSGTTTAESYQLMGKESKWYNRLEYASSNSSSAFYLARTSSAGLPDGTLGWNYATGNYIRASPILSSDDSVIYVGSGDGSLYAIDTSSGTKLWSYPTGIEASPILSSDEAVIYVGSTDNSLYAIDTSSGIKLWSYATGNYIRASPILSSDDSVIYVGSWDYSLYAIETSSGNKLWSYPTGYWIEASPILSSDEAVLYVGSTDNSLYAIETSSGNKLWSYATGDYIIASPILSRDDSVIYVGSFDNSLYAIETSSGNMLWSYATGSYIYASPILSSDEAVLYVGSWDNSLYAIETSSGTKLWSYYIGSYIYASPILSSDEAVLYVGSDYASLYAIETSSGTKLWSYATRSAIYASPILSSDDSVIYVGSDDGSLYAIETSSGNKLWSYATGNQILASPILSSDGRVFVGSYSFPCKPSLVTQILPSTFKWSYATGSAIYASPILSSDEAVLYVGSFDNSLYAIETSSGKKLWSYATGGDIYASPILSSDGAVLYVGSYRSLYAIETSSGNKLWSYATGNWIDASPILSSDEAVLYVGSYDYSLYAIETSSGNKLWSYATGWYIYESPILSSDDSVIYVGSGDNSLYAIDTSSGTKLWSYATGGDIYASPILSSDDSVIYVGSGDKSLYAIKTSSGTKLWSYATGGSIYGGILSSDDSVIYVGSGDSSLYAIETSSGNKLWSYATGGYIRASPILSSDEAVIYVGSVDNSLYAIETSSGNKLWSYATGGYIYASPILSSDDSVIYVGSNDYSLYAIETSSGNKLWNYTTGSYIRASPILSSDDSVVYVGSYDGSLYAISLAPFPLPPPQYIHLGEKSRNNYTFISDLTPVSEKNSIYAVTPLTSTVYEISGPSNSTNATSRVVFSTSSETSSSPFFVASGSSTNLAYLASETGDMITILDTASSTWEIVKSTDLFSFPNILTSSVDRLLVHESTTTFDLFFIRSKDVVRYQSSTDTLTTSASAKYSMSMPYWFMCDSDDYSSKLESSTTSPDTTNYGVLEAMCSSGNGLIYYQDFSYEFSAGAFFSQKELSSFFLSMASENCSATTVYENTCKNLQAIPPFTCTSRDTISNIVSSLYGNLGTLMAVLCVPLTILLRTMTGRFQQSSTKEKRASRAASRAATANDDIKKKEVKWAVNPIVDDELHDEGDTDVDGVEMLSFSTNPMASHASSGGKKGVLDEDHLKKKKKVSVLMGKTANIDDVTVKDQNDQRISALERKMDEKFESIDGKFESMEENFDQKFESMDEKFERLESMMKLILERNGCVTI